MSVGCTGLAGVLEESELNDESGEKEMNVDLKKKTKNIKSTDNHGSVCILLYVSPERAMTRSVQALQGGLPCSGVPEEEHRGGEWALPLHRLPGSEESVGPQRLCECRRSRPGNGSRVLS